MYEAPFSISYDGFKPDDSLDNYIRCWLYNVLEYCPYDSNLSLRVVSLTRRFLAEINVRYTHEQFNGLGEEISVEDALISAESALYTQIKKWRASRFQPAVNSNERLKVLVVDDDPVSTKMIEACFHDQGCDISKATSGAEAVFTLKSKNFNFVVMDWNMIPLNGRQTLKIMDSCINVNKGLDRHKIPVVTYSSNSREAIDFPRTENLYQYAYLSKTSSLKRTVTLIKRLVEQSQSLSKNAN